MTARDPEWIDDVMAIADAVGVNAAQHPEVREPGRPLHPSMQQHLADPSLEQLLADWSRAATGEDFEHLLDPPAIATELIAEPDHATCEHADCDTVVCCCDTDHPCPGTVEQACTHHNLLCDLHRLDCTDCLNDFRADGGF